MPLIPFPNVANSSGVPTIPRAAGSQAVVQSLLGLANGILWSALQTDRRWGARKPPYTETKP